MATIERFLNELSAVLPEERIYSDELRTLAWGTDASFYRLTPQVVIRAMVCLSPFVLRARRSRDKV